MPERKSSFIKVDELLPEVSLEQAAAFYGVSLPEMRQVGDEVRMRCFLACGRSEETGDRAIAVQVDNPVKPWKCHVYQCQKGGNLVGLCDLMAPGTNAGGKPRGERFKQIAADLMAITRGEQLSPADRTTAAAAVGKRDVILSEFRTDCGLGCRWRKIVSQEQQRQRNKEHTQRRQSPVCVVTFTENNCLRFLIERFA